MTPHAPLDAARSASIAAIWAATLLASGPASAEPTRLHAPAQEQRTAGDEWTAPDKQIHFAGSFAIAASLRAAGRSDGESFGGAVGIGVLKELYDAALKPGRQGRRISWKDLAVDVLGATAGVAIAGALDR